ncbi:MAG: hypothetical protein KBA26_08205 [Candidatus Delongbacteria bacterium]|nr:hypothetical protein [Candidatus Delongbacteria bacterium]
MVFGHTRAYELQSVLDSLKRQNEGMDIHVWLDGHEWHPHLQSKVETCVAMVKAHHPETHLVTMNGHIGYNKLIINGLEFMAKHYEGMIILEDDCFPTASAIRMFSRGLEEIEDQPEIFSVYGHHFLTPSEKETITRFQGWGWATTRHKLLPILDQLMNCFIMPEKDYLEWIDHQLDDEVVRRLDVTPGRNCISTMKLFFSWDSCLCLLTAQNKMLHRKTPIRVIYNCGMGEDSSHFPNINFVRKPPYNMIPPNEIWNHY